MKRRYRDRTADIPPPQHSNSRCRCKASSLHLLSWCHDIFDRLQGHRPCSSSAPGPQQSHLSKTKAEQGFHKSPCRQTWTTHTNSSNFSNSTSSSSNNRIRWLKYLAQDSLAWSSSRISKWPRLSSSMISSSKRQQRRPLPSFNNSRLQLDRRNERKAAVWGWPPEQMQMIILTDVMKTYSVPY